MAEVILFINDASLNEMLKGPTGDVARDLRARGRRVLYAAKAQVGVDTGRLKAELKMNDGMFAKGRYVMIGAGLPARPGLKGREGYALWHHEGTRPHTIASSMGRVLAFPKSGRIVYAKKVHHPGTRPNRYLSDNLPLAVL